MFLFEFFLFDTARRRGRNSSENYHLRRTKPFHRRDPFNINTLFLPHVSNVPEYQWGRFLTSLNYAREKRDLSANLHANKNTHVG